MVRTSMIALGVVATLGWSFPVSAADAVSTVDKAAASEEAKDAKTESPGDDAETVDKLTERVKALEAKVASLEGQVAKLGKGRRFVGPKQVWESGSTRVELSPMGVTIKSPSGVRIESGGDIDVKSRAGVTVTGSGGLDLKGATIRLNGGNQRVLRGPVKIRNTCIPNRSTGAFYCADGVVEPGSQSRSVFVD